MINVKSLKGNCAAATVDLLLCPDQHGVVQQLQSRIVFSEHMEEKVNPPVSSATLLILVNVGGETHSSS